MCDSWNAGKNILYRVMQSVRQVVNQNYILLLK